MLSPYIMCLCNVFLCFFFFVVVSSEKIGLGYRLVFIEENPDGGLVGHLQLKKSTNTYGADIPNLSLFIKHETQNRLRVQITDAEKERWEVPYNLLQREQAPSSETINGIITKTTSSSACKASEYPGDELIFSYLCDPFGFAVKRKSNGETLFNSSDEPNDPYSSLVFKDQYLEISTRLPETASIYGLGENTQPGGIKIRPNDAYTLYTTDLSAIKLNIDLYGSHPVFMDLRNDINGEAFAHGVLLLNSNGMDIVYRGSSLTYKVIGGVFDFYFFSGSKPLDVVEQYTSFVGRPAPMPYWALGFHQCRWGYRNLSVVESVVEGYKRAQIPLDVIWSDDDHMDAAKDFTLDPVNYPQPKLRAFLNKIHSQGMKYIVLIDPGIALNDSYGAYTRGIAKDVYIKYEGEPYLAQVWPGPVYFPDFLNPDGVSWWADEIARFRALVPFDGLWLDMNEPSNFCTGKCRIPTAHLCLDPALHTPWICCLDCQNITGTRWDEPPYKINASGIRNRLGFKTIAAGATHYEGVLEYNAHSLYGLSQTVATHKALRELEGKRRPFVLTRSTFVGSGAYAAHWTGDNKATWENLRYSVSTILNFGIFGMPMVGADICGFYPDPTELEELCNRWIELGAFYPFSRDHANLASPRQELYVWDSVAKSARNALGLRYRLLPYLYTLNYEARWKGAPMARPVFFSFPRLTESYNVSTQFLLGSGILVSPVLTQGASNVDAMFPPGSWYNLFDMSKVVVSKDARYVSLDAPLNEVNVHVYGGTILPMQRGGLISVEARGTPFALVVAFSFGASEGEAEGNVYVDDDERPEMKLVEGEATYIEFRARVRGTEVEVWSEVEMGVFATEKGLVVEKVTVLGLEGSGSGLSMRVDGAAVSDLSGAYFSGGGSWSSSLVEIGGLSLPLGKNLYMSWSMGIKD